MPYKDPQALKERNRRYYQEHRDEVIQKVRDWAAAHPERVDERRRAHRAENLEHYKELERRRYDKNREYIVRRVTERERRRREETPDVVRSENRERQARRRARLRGLFIETVRPEIVWERDRGTCGICGELADHHDWHLDHVIPIAKGGPHSYANVQVAHPSCNRRKAAS